MFHENKDFISLSAVTVASTAVQGTLNRYFLNEYMNICHLDKYCTYFIFFCYFEYSGNKGFYIKSGNSQSMFPSGPKRYDLFILIMFNYKKTETRLSMEGKGKKHGYSGR